MKWAKSGGVGVTREEINPCVIEKSLLQEDDIRTWPYANDADNIYRGKVREEKESSRGVVVQRVSTRGCSAKTLNDFSPGLEMLPWKLLTSIHPE